jgi:hypothetical protein
VTLLTVGDRCMLDVGCIRHRGDQGPEEGLHHASALGGGLVRAAQSSPTAVTPAGEMGVGTIEGQADVDVLLQYSMTYITHSASVTITHHGGCPTCCLFTGRAATSRSISCSRNPTSSMLRSRHTPWAQGQKRLFQNCMAVVEVWEGGEIEGRGRVRASPSATAGGCCG